eukprot:7317733-Ditylum_brightwellii.AAC.1
MREGQKVGVTCASGVILYGGTGGSCGGGYHCGCREDFFGNGVNELQAIACIMLLEAAAGEVINGISTVGM